MTPVLDTSYGPLTSGNASQGAVVGVVDTSFPTAERGRGVEHKIAGRRNRGDDSRHQFTNYAKETNHVNIYRRNAR